MELTLNPEEQEFLSKTLEQCHRELLNEIAHTDHRDFKRSLLQNEKLLDALIGRLRQPAAPEMRG